MDAPAGRKSVLEGFDHHKNIKRTIAGFVKTGVPAQKRAGGLS
jgi:hypothetical protein